MAEVGGPAQRRVAAQSLDSRRLIGENPGTDRFGIEDCAQFRFTSGTQIGDGV